MAAHCQPRRTAEGAVTPRPLHDTRDTAGLIRRHRCTLHKSARVWDATAKDIAVLRGYDNVVYSAAWSPDGRRIVTASADVEEGDLAAQRQ
jgi:WD40 repeat protein